MLAHAARPRQAASPAKPVLDLSGPKLRRALENLVGAAEPTGGVERCVTALALKSSLFAERFGSGRAGELTESGFLDLCAFITPVRRRLGAWLAANGFARMRRLLGELVDGSGDLDSRMAAFRAAFPDDRAHRWTRDLAAEVLHFTDPEGVPLMTRWVWDARIGTGVLREIWHADDVDAATIAVADDLATFATLGEELQGFLADNSVFRDLPLYVDLLTAHIYADYINDRGGTYLKADFTGRGDPMSHTRRLLGLDGVDSPTGRTRLKLIDGVAHMIGAPARLTS